MEGIVLFSITKLHPSRADIPASPPGGGRAALSLLGHREGQLWAPSGSQPANFGAMEGWGTGEDRLHTLLA